MIPNLLACNLVPNWINWSCFGFFLSLSDKITASRIFKKSFSSIIQNLFTMESDGGYAIAPPFLTMSETSRSVGRPSMGTCWTDNVGWPGTLIDVHGCNGPGQQGPYYSVGSSEVGCCILAGLYSSYRSKFCGKLCAIRPCNQLTQNPQTFVCFPIRPFVCSCRQFTRPCIQCLLYWVVFHAWRCCSWCYLLWYCQS
jgi:hypothetical protein